MSVPSTSHKSSISDPGSPTSNKSESSTRSSSLSGRTVIVVNHHSSSTKPLISPQAAKMIATALLVTVCVGALIAAGAMSAGAIPAAFIVGFAVAKICFIAAGATALPLSYMGAKALLSLELFSKPNNEPNYKNIRAVAIKEMAEAKTFGTPGENPYGAGGVLNGYSGSQFVDLE